MFLNLSKTKIVLLGTGVLLNKQTSGSIGEMPLISSHGEAKPRTHDLTATFCTITKPL